MILLDDYIREIERLNASLCDMPTEEVEGLKEDARRKQLEIANSLSHDPIIYFYAGIYSACRIELEHRFASLPEPEANAATASV